MILDGRRIQPNEREYLELLKELESDEIADDPRPAALVASLDVQEARTSESPGAATLDDYPEECDAALCLYQQYYSSRGPLETHESSAVPQLMVRQAD